MLFLHEKSKFELCNNCLELIINYVFCTTVFRMFSFYSSSSKSTFAARLSEKYPWMCFLSTFFYAIRRCAHFDLFTLAGNINNNQVELGAAATLCYRVFDLFCEYSNSWIKTILICLLVTYLTQPSVTMDREARTSIDGTCSWRATTSLCFSSGCLIFLGIFLFMSGYVILYKKAKVKWVFFICL